MLMHAMLCKLRNMQKHTLNNSHAGKCELHTQDRKSTAKSCIRPTTHQAGKLELQLEASTCRQQHNRQLYVCCACRQRPTTDLLLNCQRRVHVCHLHTDDQLLSMPNLLTKLLPFCTRPESLAFPEQLSYYNLLDS